MDVIGSLKLRSGRSVKAKALDVVEFQQGNQIFFLLLLSNLSVKFAVAMRNTQLEEKKIQKGNSYLIKNCTHTETLGEIPVLKVQSQTVFRELQIPQTNHLTFTMDEISTLKELNLLGYYEDAQPVALNVQPESNILSLHEYIQCNPRELRTNQYVEVSLNVWFKSSTSHIS